MIYLFIVFDDQGKKSQSCQSQTKSCCFVSDLILPSGMPKSSTRALNVARRLLASSNSRSIWRHMHVRPCTPVRCVRRSSTATVRWGSTSTSPTPSTTQTGHSSLVTTATSAATPGGSAQWVNSLYPPHNEVVAGGYIGFTPSVRPSVRPASRVHSVAPTVLVGSISYLYILSSNFRRCVACKVNLLHNSKFGFLAVFLNL